MPPPADPQLSALRLARPAQWHARVRAAITKAGSVPGGAAILGIHSRTLFRWIASDPTLARGLSLPLPRARVTKAVRA